MVDLDAVEKALHKAVMKAFTRGREVGLEEGRDAERKRVVGLRNGYLRVVSREPAVREALENFDGKLLRGEHFIDPSAAAPEPPAGK